MKELEAGNSKLVFDEGANLITISGSMRLANIQEYEKIKQFLFDSCQGLDEVKVDVSGLEFLNSAGITTLSMFILTKKKEANIKVTFVGSKSVFWQEKALENFSKLWSEVNVDIKD